MADRIELSELETYLYHSADILRTHVDASDYKMYVFPLLFFKRICDVYDEETEKKKAELGDAFFFYPEKTIHRFSIPEGCHWRDVRNATENIGVAIVDAFLGIEDANGSVLQGVFGHAAWTNKNRLPDETLKNLIEHFSSKTLTLDNCPEDELGQAYEYLIKKFGDDSGHTSQEFYTNRTVVHLMTEMLKPQPGETIYDPTCGSAGMLISCIAYLKEKGLEWRNVKCYGQEINELSSSIGKMNLFLHGVEYFEVVNDDTLKRPAFVDHGELRQFDLCLANPPYSISTWNRDAFEHDPYGRNFLGTPPQGRADYAFFQHILKSLNPKTGRCAILFPHGVLTRNEEKQMRENLIKQDLLECVNFFLNWSDFEKYEFNLPPIEIQRELTELLWAAENTKLAYVDLLRQTDELVKSQFIEMFGDCIRNDKEWNVRLLQDVLAEGCRVTYGIVKTEDDIPGGVPVFRPVDISQGHVPTRSELKRTSKEISDQYKRTILNGDELLITIRGSVGETFQISKEFEGCNVARNIVPLRANTEILLQGFLKAVIDSVAFQEKIASITKGVALKGININEFKVCPIILPPIEMQQQWVEFAQQSDKSKHSYHIRKNT